MRTPVIAANWKMNKVAAEATAFVREFADQHTPSGVEAVICPPFTAIAAVTDALRAAGREDIRVGAQDLFWEEKGAFTGEISASMIRDLGCTFVIVAHSERRRYFGETDETASKKVRAAAAAGLTPILCVGETVEERDSGQTRRVLEGQVRGALEGVAGDVVGRMVIAYEPVWAIGSGKPASPADAREAAALIRAVVSEICSDAAAEGLRVQYGGSVDPSNIGSFMAEPGVDGALVGGASLDPAKFAKLLDYRR